MSRTRQITISFGVWTPIKAFDGSASGLTIEEFHGAYVSGAPTTDLLIAKPTATDPPRQVAAGQSYTFSKNGRLFNSGEAAGYVSPAANVTTTLSIDEQSAP